MIPSAKQFLSYVAGQPKGRVGFSSCAWEAALRLAAECLEAGYVKERPLHPWPHGFQITDAGRAYLAGAFG